MGLGSSLNTLEHFCSVQNVGGVMSTDDGEEFESQNSVYVARFWVWCVVIGMLAFVGSCADKIHRGGCGW